MNRGALPAAELDDGAGAALTCAGRTSPPEALAEGMNLVCSRGVRSGFAKRIGAPG